MFKQEFENKGDKKLSYYNFYKLLTDKKKFNI